MSTIIKKITLEVCESEEQPALGAVLIKWIESIETGQIRIDDPKGTQGVAKELFNNVKIEEDK